MVVEGKLDLTEQVNKQYRAPRKGKSADKKKVEDKKKRGLPTEPDKTNAKAFSTGRPGTAEHARKKLDRAQNYAHVPRVDKTFADAFNEPPETVAVVGPPGSGKTTLIRSLVKQYTKQNLTNVKGPVTCIAGKQRRITFFECPNNVNAMCDVARVADLVLLMVDASFGFEMETFEFLNVSKTHGFPKLIGVLTHLDKLKDNKQLKKTKKALRHRFWQEIVAGAKLFYLSGMDKNLYPAKEVINLTRFIAVTKLTPQNWRTTHSCVLADRMEDITDPALQQRDPQCDRTVALYGYVRGCPLKANQRIHIPGVGDYSLASCHHLDDPCALPQKGNKKKTRHLSERDKRLYAPMADVGSLMYDADAVYIKVDKEHESGVVEVGEGPQLLERLKDAKGSKAIDESLREQKIALFEGGGEIGGGAAADDEEDGEFDAARDMPDHLKEQRYSEQPVYDAAGRLRRKVSFAYESQIVDEREGDDDTSDEDESDGEADDGRVLAADRPDAVEHDLSAADLKKIRLDGDGDDDEDDLFFKVGQQSVVDAKDVDVTRDVRGVLEEDWEVEAVRESIRDLFVTGAWTEEESKGTAGGDTAVAASLSAGASQKKAVAAVKKKTSKTLEEKGYESVSEGDDEAEMADYADDEDLLGEDLAGEEDEEDEEGEEAGDAEDGAAPPARKRSRLEDLKESVRSMIPSALLDADKQPEAPAAEEDDEKKDEKLTAREKNARKKAEKKRLFDEMYDLNKIEGGGKDHLEKMEEEMQSKHQKTQKAIDEATGGDIEEKIKTVGYYAGLYVRIVVEGIPAEFVSTFDPKMPLIAGGLLASEDRLGVIYIRMKKHRWYPKLLKAQDPLVLSVGWRRFQTQPIFAVEDPNGRNRYLKYTPLHTHCIAAVYGPVTPPNTGVICFTNAALQPHVNHFRCSATGYVMEVDHSSRIVKKLKLKGVPAKVYKNTAFIKNMFTSALEVAKFEGAKLQTVSGLRGTVKKSVSGKGGVFRATFEDKISKGDIVFLKTWKAVEPSKYYNPVTNLLQKEWQGMRSMTELRRANNIAVPYSADSIYREVKRTKQFNTTLKVPANLEGNMPFEKKKLRFVEKQGMGKVDKAIAEETAFALEPGEQRARDLKEILSLKEKMQKRSQQEARSKKRTLREKQLQQKEEKVAQKLKELKKKNSKLKEFKEQLADKRRKGK